MTLPYIFPLIPTFLRYSREYCQIVREIAALIMTYVMVKVTFKKGNNLHEMVDLSLNCGMQI